jgi:hypothetical protein
MSSLNELRSIQQSIDNQKDSMPELDYQRQSEIVRRMIRAKTSQLSAILDKIKSGYIMFYWEHSDDSIDILREFVHMWNSIHPTTPFNGIIGGFMNKTPFYSLKHDSVSIDQIMEIAENTTLPL